MAVAQRMTERDYIDLVESTPDRIWELYDGILVEKPGVTWKHADIVEDLADSLRRQLARRTYRVRQSDGRVRKPADTIFIPDIAVIPNAYGEEFRDRPVLAIVSGPLPLVFEVWSPSTGSYDVDTKLPIYQQRGDLEIWRIHPFERTLTRWVRQVDGSYQDSLHRGGIITPAALPGVTVDLDQLLAI